MPSEPARQGQTLYRGIADDLRRAVTTGELAPGAPVPTVDVLMDRYNVSRNTILLALKALTNEGLITGGQTRRGRHVRRREPLWIYASRSESRARRRTMGVDSWVDDVAAQGREAETRISAVEIIQAPPDVANRLEVEPGAMVVARRRVRLVDEQPWNLNDSYFPLEIAQENPAILNPEDVKSGITVYLANRGHAQTQYADEITGRMPTPDEALALEIGPGVPVICHVRTGRTSERPVRVTMTVLPADRHRLLYEIPA